MRGMILAVLVAQAPLTPSLAFEDYAVSTVFQGKPAEPSLSSHSQARTYRTALRNQARKGPNFAGGYTIVQIGCGTGCSLLAVVDARTGRVFFPTGLRDIHWAGWWHDPYGPQYRVSSRLIVVYGQVNSEEAPYGVTYFEWTGTDFKLLRFELRDRGKPPQ